MIIMAVDLGKARTGLAISDEGESFAFPKEVITEYNTDRLCEKISEKAEVYGAGMIVVGLPRNMDGSVGFRAQECLQIAEEIQQRSGLPTEMWDERCTTVSAHETLSRNNVRGKKRKETVDAVAAVLILEDYLRFRKNRRPG